MVAVLCVRMAHAGEKEVHGLEGEAEGEDLGVGDADAVVSIETSGWGDDVDEGAEARVRAGVREGEDAREGVSNEGVGGHVSARRGLGDGEDAADEGEEGDEGETEDEVRSRGRKDGTTTRRTPEESSGRGDG